MGDIPHDVCVHNNTRIDKRTKIRGKNYDNQKKPTPKNFPEKKVNGKNQRG